jgi:hypothetical protein
MNRKIIILIAALLAIGSMAFAQDLKIDFQVKVGAEDPANYFTFTGPIRYIAVDKDQLDSKTGASQKRSTEVFQAYKFDVKGKSVLPDGLRGLFLFGVANLASQQGDMLNAAKAADGSITVQFVHRGTAYMIVTDKTGKLALTTGTFKKRAVGYIKGEGPQVIHKDFSEDGTPAKIDWKKVWDDKIAGGKDFGAASPVKTGTITADAVAADAMYFWDGALQATFDKQILKIAGGLNAVKR